MNTLEYLLTSLNQVFACLILLRGRNEFTNPREHCVLNIEGPWSWMTVVFADSVLLSMCRFF